MKNGNYKPMGGLQVHHLNKGKASKDPLYYLRSFTLVPKIKYATEDKYILTIIKSGPSSTSANRQKKIVSWIMSIVMSKEGVVDVK